MFEMLHLISEIEISCLNTAHNTTYNSRNSISMSHSKDKHPNLITNPAKKVLLIMRSTYQ